MKTHLLFAAALLFAATGAAFAEDNAPVPHDHAMPDMSAMTADPLAPVTVGDIEITTAFARATLPNAPVAGGYLTITNKGKTDDRLVAASSPVAGKDELHEMTMQDDVMKMQALPDGIAVPAGETVTLSPGGMHIMFMQLQHPFVEGETVPVTLKFEQAGSVTVQLSIAGIGADAPNVMPDMQM
jgi:copper(I)-binding protein